jgi:hypothetical protein
MTTLIYKTTGTFIKISMFCRERGGGEERVGTGAGGRNDPNNVCKCE